ncbi:creatininase family protein [Micromonospora echinofusca]|uniref:Creatininase family protein n=1 Tax=Micromonospora echinofusca TaxID=47858 RepID=A0ABS3VL33_MICEH|nr:creatininase family protein [Micromonospora echinofusca]MBO4205191.1 creatininase family protein [Micromonospora echinofusca]
MRSPVHVGERVPPGTIAFDVLTRDELNPAAAGTTLVFPLGSTEQHAHHLPTRTDSACVDAIAHRSARLAAEQVPVLVAPTLPFGCAHHHLPLGATLSLTTSTYVDLLCDLVGGAVREGFRSVVLLNGHGGNDSAIRLAVDRLVHEERLDLHIAAASYWVLADDVLRAHGFASPGHAGHFETSLMLALEPDLVHLDRRVTDPTEWTPLGRPDIPGASIRRPGLWEASDGRTDDAARATAELGAALVDEIVAVVARFLVRFHRSTPAGGSDVAGAFVSHQPAED